MVGAYEVCPTDEDGPVIAWSWRLVTLGQAQRYQSGLCETLGRHSWCVIRRPTLASDKKTGQVERV